MLVSPPRARLALRVGVVGHRPNRLPSDEPTLAALRARIAEVLQVAKDEVLRFQAEGGDAALYAPDAPVLRAVSPLAEGTDRIFAEEALACGYALICPMPFAQAEFETDFAGKRALEPDSLAKFRDLLARAEAGAGLVTFELDGRRTDEGGGYGAAGRVVLNQSDLLVAVWDGEQKAGPGGTVDTVHDAIRFHVPVLWIDARDPDRWAVLRDADDIARVERKDGARKARPAVQPIAQAVAEIVRREIALPEVDTEQARAHAQDFFAERRPAAEPDVRLEAVPQPRRRIPGQVSGDPHQGLRSRDARVLAGRARRREHRLRLPLEGPAGAGGLLGQRPTARELRLGRQAGRPEGRAYRSAYILSYLLAAAAVFVALLPLAMGWTQANVGAEIASIEGEFVILLAILGLLLCGHWRRWHERWMEYRLLAELIRQLKFLIPLGGGRHRRARRCIWPGTAIRPRPGRPGSFAPSPAPSDFPPPR